MFSKSASTKHDTKKRGSSSPLDYTYSNSESSDSSSITATSNSENEETSFFITSNPSTRKSSHDSEDGQKKKKIDETHFFPLKKAESHRKPYFVNTFIGGIDLALSSQFRHLFTPEEITILKSFHCNYNYQHISEPALTLFCRIQRRRRNPYVTSTDLLNRYYQNESEEFVNSLIEELLHHQLILCLSLQRGCDTTEKKKNYIIDPLWGLLAFKIHEIGEMLTSVGGPLLDAWKEYRTKKRYKTKRLLVNSIITICNDSQTLSNTSLASQLFKLMIQRIDQWCLITIPLPLRRLFQLIDVLLGFPSEDFAETVGSFPISNINKDIRKICQSRRLTSLHYIEPQFRQVFFSTTPITQCTTVVTSKDNKTTDNNHLSSMLFYSREDLEAFEAGRFIQKFIEIELAKQHYEILFDISEILESQLCQFVMFKEYYLDTNSFSSLSIKESTKYIGLLTLIQFAFRFRHPFFFRYTYEWLIASSLWDLVKIHESYNKDYFKAVRIIELLLNSGLVTSRRHKMYQRLTINYFSNLKKPQLALEFGLQALNEKDLPIAILTDISRRIKRILNTHESFIENNNHDEDTTTKRSGLIPFHTKNLKNQQIPLSKIRPKNNRTLTSYGHYIPTKTAEIIHSLLQLRLEHDLDIKIRIVTATPVITGGTKKRKCFNERQHIHVSRPLFMSKDDQLYSVEKFALDWYYNHEPENINDDISHDISWIGFHDEGAILLELFGILMSNILFDTSIPHTFILPTQTAPLDLFTESFYQSREERLEKRFEWISHLSSQSLFLDVITQCRKLYPKQIINVTWFTLDKIKRHSPNSIEWWKLWRNHIDLSKIIQLTGGTSDRFWLLTPESSYGYIPTKESEMPPKSLITMSHNKTTTPFIESFNFETSWQIRRFDQFLFIAAIAAGIGGRVLSSIFRILSKNFNAHRSGFPDLILWRIQQNSEKSCNGFLNHSFPQDNVKSLFLPLEVMFSEVKSENDSMSEKQRIWLSTIHNAGGRAELFCVRSIHR